MNRIKLFGAVSLTASAFTIWLYIVTQVQPDKSNISLLITFFASFIIWLGSLLATAFYFAKIHRGNREVIYAHIKPSIRQGFIVSATIAMLLILQMLHVLSLWDTFIVLVVALVFEIGAQQRPKITKS